MKGLFTLFICTSSMLQAVDFESKILPILEAKCFKCHGEKKQKSGFRLDNRLDLLKGGHSGEVAVKLGYADESFLIEALTTDDEDMIMPPKGDRLTAEEVELFRTWINEGLYWPGQMQAQAEVKTEVNLWPLKPVKRPVVPAGESSTVIDRFIEKSQKQKGLEPLTSASARDLIRRVSVILTGLRPSLKEVEEFELEHAVNPKETYEKLVDKLLNSKHFGERFAQHWLDVIRWGETTGAEANLYRKNAWQYRDYVIDAFNQDLSYDQFIKEQLAGDVLGAPYATGFLVAGPNVPKNSIGNQISDHKSARSDRLDQTIQTVSASILGMTVGCARCHDHKFDPISIEDYYSMKAVFEDLEYESRRPELAEDHPQKNLEVKLKSEIDDLRSSLKYAVWVEDWTSYQQVNFPLQKTRHLRIEFNERKTVLDELEILDDEGRNLLLYKDFELKTQQEGRVPNGPDRSLVDNSYGEWRSFKVKLPRESKLKPWIEVTFKKPQLIGGVRLSEDREVDEISDYITKSGTLKKAEPVDHYEVSVKPYDQWEPIASWKEFQMDYIHEEEFKQSIDLIQDKISRLREETPRPAFIGKFLKKEEGLRKVRRSEDDFISTTGYLNSLSFPEETRVLKRGDVASPGELVEPAGLGVINGALDLKGKHAGPERRLAYGEWLSSRENPLTARVMVNRLWHHVFGRGLVVTGSDFGKAGAEPDHPELLDWLAHEFMNPEHASKPWSVKHLLKLMVMSDAFQRSSKPDSKNADIDSDSIHIWRYHPRRVEAEVLRDSILQVTGNLNPKLGGRGVNIYEPKLLFGHWKVEDNFSEKTWRRLLYQDKMRRSDDGLFSAFDLPDCGQIRDKRSISTTPLQALNLLNAEFVISQSELLAQSIQESGFSEKAQVIECFKRLFNRLPNQQELASCLRVAESQSLAIVCRALFNSNEFSLLQ